MWEQGEVKKHYAAKPGLRLELLHAAPCSCEFPGGRGGVFLERSLGKLISYKIPKPNATALNRTKTTAGNPPPAEPRWSSLVRSSRVGHLRNETVRGELDS